MKYKYMNLYTGEIYHNLAHAMISIIQSMIHFPACRSVQMFRLEKGDF